MGNVSESHPLQQLFTELVNRNYEEALGHNDNELNSYVASMLCEFCDAEQLFKIRNAEGGPLHDVCEMLLACDPIYGDAASFGRERQVRKHRHDMALSSTGMFPESINHQR